MKNFLMIMCMTLGIGNLAVAQDKLEVIEGKPTQVTLRDLFSNQEAVLSEQRAIRKDLRDIKDRIVNLNVNFLSWQESNPNTGDNKEGCLFCKYENEVMIGGGVLAVVAIIMILGKIGSFFNRPKAPQNIPVRGSDV